MRNTGWMAMLIVGLAGGLAWACSPGDGTSIEGTIEEINAEVQQLVVAGTTVQVTEDTVIKKNGQVLAFEDLTVGLTVAVCGTMEDDVLIAHRITVKSCRAACSTGPNWQWQYGKAPAAPALSVAPAPLTPEEVEGLVFMREEEKLARDVYLTLAEQWDVPIFLNIAASEQTHMNAIYTLLVRYDVPDPVAGMEVGEFATEEFQTLYAALVASGGESLAGALTAGATIEEIDIIDLVEKLEDATHRAIRRVYQNLERASENHLRAFVGQLAALGTVYEPQYLDPEWYAEIIGG